MTPCEFRTRCRAGEFRRPTAGFAPGYVQTNLVVLPEVYAGEFHRFCERNPKPCPLLEFTAPGDPVPKMLAEDADLRTDLPLYRVYEHGKLVAEPTNITAIWRDDFVAFLLGCSFTFEAALVREGLTIRHLDERRADGLPKNVSMYRTSIPCESSGVFQGPLVVSMRPFLADDARRAFEITARFPTMHGSPVHQGNPREIGIEAIASPDWGDAVTLHPNEIPVFWACGVTPQAALLASRIPLAITHAPGHMFLTDRRDQEFEVSR